ncbi:hypothetical protein BH23VER1_BH23VER1_11620 [soil metagenome]
MSPPTYFAAVAAIIGLSCQIAPAQFEQLWILGFDDNNNMEFAQENGSANPVEVGSAFALDDDYYFEGTTDSFGPVTFDEEWSLFERALTSGDPRVRIHFPLTAEEAAATTQFQLLVDLFALGSSASGMGSHHVQITFNDKRIFQQSAITENTFVDTTFSGIFSGAVAGENIVTIERTGGSPVSWIQFDFIELLAEINPDGCDQPVCDFSVNRTQILPGDEVTLAWFAHPEAVLEIDNGVGPVTVDAGGIGSVTVSPAATTTYTIMGDLAGTVAALEVTVVVDILDTFSASGAVALSDAVSRPGQPVVLSWVLADPAATVEIDNGVGDVTAITGADGTGSIVLEGPIAPTEPTTYTLTATRGEESESAQATVELSDWQLLWQVGIEDDSQAEFAQENGVVSGPPGSPFDLDDDYYTAGDYTDYDAFIGVVEAPEPWQQFERAVTSGDPNMRVHFTMTPEQAVPTNEIRVRLALILGGWPDSTPDGPGGVFGVHDVDVTFNGELLFSQDGISSAEIVDEIVLASEVGAVPGHNQLEVTRTGGDSAGNGGNSGWIQLDFVTGEVLPSGAPEGIRITAASFDPDFGELSVTWTSQPGRTYRIETSPDLSAWTDILTEVAAAGNLTTIPVDVGFPAPGQLYVRVAEE